MHSALITGGAGFIGSHLSDRLLSEGWKVTVVDNFDPFYSPASKMRNIADHAANAHYRLIREDIRNLRALLEWQHDSYDVIVHLAGRAGVRPSIEDPHGYQAVNVHGTLNMLEFARQLGVRQFVFASSSSVYGVCREVPWREDGGVLLPISPYACTKISGELIGHVYSQLYGIRFIGLRFFTVYGPRQRPDLAIHKFTRMALDSKAIPVFGDGSMRRDYTFIDDIIGGIRSAMDYKSAEYEIVNLGTNRPVSLAELIKCLEDVLGRKIAIDRRQLQAGDVPETYADITKARALFGYDPKTPLVVGLERFVGWLQAEVGAAPARETVLA